MALTNRSMRQRQIFLDLSQHWTQTTASSVKWIKSGVSKMKTNISETRAKVEARFEHLKRFDWEPLKLAIRKF